MRAVLKHVTDASKKSKTGETVIHWARFTIVPTPKIYQKVQQLDLPKASTLFCNIPEKGQDSMGLCQQGYATIMASNSLKVSQSVVGMESEKSIYPCNPLLFCLLYFSV